MKKEGKYIGRYISQIHRKGNIFISKELNVLGIGSGQVMFLLELYRGDGRSQEDLAEVLNIDKGTTARALKKLEDAEFIIRRKDEIDKRAYKVCLTDKGKNMKNNVCAIMKNWENKITSNLDEKESETILYLLNKICTTM
ncbi:MAG: MarR family winged helix-turn-helix transcriptional regulator [Peptostreptococcaceae bacterium]